MGGETYKPTLVVDDVQDGQVVHVHEGIEQHAVGTVKLKQHHAGLSDVVVSSERFWNFRPLTKKRVKRPCCKTNDAG